MSLLSKIVFLLLLVSVFSPSYAAVDSVEFTDCKVFSDEDKKDGDKKGDEEEEPDCE
ncbi:MAG: hypothetical protein KJN89_02915 [Gammaproteobacteria bacterium]|nr:hypothetical protein [Gammaproteobacteria bacterium]MBT8133978.1 hypothetical protein [Gammaproteobacteria bacterium]NNJ49300.1 hypothetical protein [Gammaproteobacteria bacterium]